MLDINRVIHSSPFCAPFCAPFFSFLVFPSFFLRFFFPFQFRSVKRGDLWKKRSSTGQFGRNGKKRSAKRSRKRVTVNAPVCESLFGLLFCFLFASFCPNWHVGCCFFFSCLLFTLLNLKGKKNRKKNEGNAKKEKKMGYSLFQLLFASFLLLCLQVIHNEHSYHSLKATTYCGRCLRASLGQMNYQEGLGS